MVETASDSHSFSLRLPANIGRIERYLPVLVSLHALLTPSYLGVALPFPFALWLGFHLIVPICLLLLMQRDTEQKFIAFRAFYLAFVVWLVILIFGIINSFFLFWHIAILIIYPSLLPKRVARILMIVVSLSYLLLYPFSPAGTQLTVFIVRAGTMYFISWATYRLNREMLSSVIERQLLRERVAEAEIERTQMEQERELLQHKMQFIDVVSHEFRTPLAIIETASYLLDNHFVQMNEEKRTTRLQEIQTQTTRLTEMLDSIVTAEKLFKLSQHAAPTPVDLRAYCEKIFEEIRDIDNRQHLITTTYEGDLSNVSIDLERLRVILFHLLTNATKYSPENSEIKVNIQRGKDEIVLQVIDKGMGIEADAARLTEPFYRGKNVTFIKGIGLGLALVYESVQQQGGKIDWTSQEGKGTTFEVHLPLPW